MLDKGGNDAYLLIQLCNLDRDRRRLIAFLELVEAYFILDNLPE